MSPVRCYRVSDRLKIYIISSSYILFAQFQNKALHTKVIPLEYWYEIKKNRSKIMLDWQLIWKSLFYAKDCSIISFSTFVVVVVCCHQKFNKFKDIKTKFCEPTLHLHLCYKFARTLSFLHKNPNFNTIIMTLLFVFFFCYTRIFWLISPILCGKNWKISVKMFKHMHYLHQKML